MLCVLVLGISSKVHAYQPPVGKKGSGPNTPRRNGPGQAPNLTHPPNMGPPAGGGMIYIYILHTHAFV